MRPNKAWDGEDDENDCHHCFLCVRDCLCREDEEGDVVREREENVEGAGN